MKKFIQDKLQVLFSTSSNAGGIALIIIFLSGVGLYTKYIYSPSQPPKKTIEIIKDIPEFSTPDERWEWIKSNASNYFFPFKKLTDQELTQLIEEDFFKCSFRFDIRSKCIFSVSNAGYTEYARRLKREPNPLEIALKKRLEISPRVPYLGYEDAVIIAAVLGDGLAQDELLNVVYRPSCCNYNAIGNGFWETSKWRYKFESEGNKFAIFLSVIYNLRPSNSNGGFTEENYEQLKVIALSKGVGDAEAAYELFKIYKDGNKYATRSYSDAYAWLLISHKQGYEYAAETLKDFETTIDKDFIIEGQKIAQKLSTESN